MSTAHREQRYAVLLSGRGTTLGALQAAAADGRLPAPPAMVVSNRADAGGLALAREAGLPARAVRPQDYPDRDSYEAVLAETIDAGDVHWLILAGYMRVLGKAFVRHFHGRMVNIHPSLLPAYRGLDTYRRALEAGERVHGSSVHFVTEELDGGPVIAQAEVEVRPGDTVASLRARTKARERKLYPLVLNWLLRERVRMENGKVLLDGKVLNGPLRFPADKEISA